MNKKLWYTAPATCWEEALPIGNGRLGAMIYGEPRNEKLQLNEESMWYGGYMNRLNPSAREHLPKVRELLRTGHIREAQELMGTTMTGCPNSMHPYQTLGDLYLYFDVQGETEQYRRTLDLQQALTTVEFQAGDTKYSRECFASKPADCIVMKIEAAGRGKVSFTARMDRNKQFDGVMNRGTDRICLWGNLGRGGQEFSLLLAAKAEGGRVKTLGESLVVENADRAYLYFRGDTTYQYSGAEKEAYVREYGKTLGSDQKLEWSEQLSVPWDIWQEWNSFERQEYLYQQALQAFLLEKQNNRIDNAMQKDYQQLKQEHIQDYRQLFDRVELQLDSSADSEASKEDCETMGYEGSTCENEEWPTDRRLREISAREDLGLVQLLFDFGRYLLIACSREEGLPATLQGLWNKDFLPPWDSKYTININTEMNYWPAEPCNLPECHLPLFRLLEKMQKRGRRTAREMYGCRGFVVHHNTDMHGDTEPQDLWLPATFWPMGGAWLSTHIWTHYCYTKDLQFLASYFPVLAEAALFFVDYLVEDGEYLVTNPSVSPENSYTLPSGETGACCVGATMDYQILRDLFTDCIGAWKELMQARDEVPEDRGCRKALIASVRTALEQIPDMPAPEELLAKLTSMLRKLPPTRVDSKGRIMEWMEEYEEPEPGHRHISHLYGLYPSDQITVDGTPELARAAERTLESRLAHGGGHTGWSRAWIINHYAKLWDGNRAYENIRKMLEISTYPNLFDKHPPFQIDGNFGACSGIAQMLVQSNNERVVLLPALPDSWRQGRVRGLKIHGNAEVDMSWRNGQLTGFALRGELNTSFLVRYRDRSFLIDL